MAVTFGASALFGAVTGWAYTGGSSSADAAIATAADALANVANSALITEKTSVQATLECNDDTNTIPATIGAVVNSLVLENITLTLSNKDSAKMSLSGHNHASNAHTTGVTVAHGISIAKAFGVADVLGGTAGTDASVESATVTISCGHADVEDGDGYNHFAGENNGPAQVVVNQVWIGVPTTAFDSDTWQGTATTTTNVNNGAVRTVVNATKYLTLAETGE